MTKYKMSWDETHHIDVEADSIEHAEKMLETLLVARHENATTFGGVIGDTHIWEDVPEIEVSDSMSFNYNTEEMNYEVIE